MKYVAGILLLLVVSLGGYGWYQETKISVLISDNQKLVIEKDAALSSVSTLEIQNQLQATQIGDAARNARNVAKEAQDARKQVDYTQRLLNNHDLGDLMAKKPGLITLKMQKATDAVFADLAAATEPE
jgi:hypothetical protein